MRRTFSLLLGAWAFGAAALLSSEALAANDLSACGEIFVQTGAQCQVYVGPVCEGMCKPGQLMAACAAELRADCAGKCHAAASADCVGGCEADCRAGCQVDPGEFNCLMTCQGDCSANCDARCAARRDKAECAASCDATCAGDCDARCKVTPPEADCDAKCRSACTGSCEAQANADCQVDCQAGGFDECQAELMGGCKLHCERPQGALFCDGQFVDVGNQLEACAMALRSLLDVTVHARGTGDCIGTSCHAEGQAGCSCDADGAPGGWWALAGLGLVIRRRRRAPA